MAEEIVKEIPLQKQIIKTIVRLSYKFSRPNIDQEQRLSLNTALTILNSALQVDDKTEKQKLLTQAVKISRV